MGEGILNKPIAKTVANTVAKYRANLPQLSDKIFLTDAGMETTLIFHEGVDLPLFASFDLLKTNEGIEQHPPLLRALSASSRATRSWASCWRARPGAPTPTGRAKLGYTREELARINRKAIAVMADLRYEFETPRSPMVISGNIGPRGDGYQPGKLMSADEAEAYHAEQIAVFRTPRPTSSARSR